MKRPVRNGRTRGRLSLNSIWGVLKYLLTPVLIWAVFRNVPLRGMVENLKSIQWGWLLLAVGLYAGQHVLFAVRWQLLMAFNRIVLPFGRVLKLHLISFLFQVFLPSGFGGDAAKFALTYRKGGKVEAFNSVLIARLSGMLILALFTLAGCLAYHGPRAGEIRLAVIVTLALLAAGVFFLIFGLPVLERWKLFRRGAILPRLMKVLRGLRRNLHPRNVWELTIISFLIQVAMLLLTLFTFYSLGVEVSLVKILIGVPVITFATMIVPTVSGMGTREYFLWLFFAAELGTREMLGSYAILSYLLLLVVSLAGMIYWIESLAVKHLPSRRPVLRR